MRLLIKSTNLSLTPAIESYLEKKIGGLEKYWPRLAGSEVLARAEVGRTTRHHQKGEVFRAEVNLDLGKNVLRAEEEAADIYEAVDRTAGKLKSQIVNYHKKLVNRRRRAEKLKSL